MTGRAKTEDAGGPGTSECSGDTSDMDAFQLALRERGRVLARTTTTRTVHILSPHDNDFVSPLPDLFQGASACHSHAPYVMEPVNGPVHADQLCGACLRVLALKRPAGRCRHCGR